MNPFKIGDIVTFKKRWEDAWGGQNYTLEVIEIPNEINVKMICLSTNHEDGTRVIGDKFTDEVNMLELVKENNKIITLFMQD